MTDATDGERSAAERRAAAHEAISDLAAAVASGAEVERISELVLASALQLTGSPLGQVGYIDEVTGHLVVPTLTRDVGPILPPEMKKVVFRKPGRGFHGWILEHRLSLLVNDTAADPRHFDPPTGHVPIRRYLGAPALAGEALYGIVAVGNAEREYGAADLAAVERLAALYALALQQARQARTLGEQEELWRQVFHSATDIMFVHGLTESGMPGPFLEVNAAGLARLGHTREEFLELTPLDLLRGVPLDRAAQVMRDLLASRHVVFETTLMTKDGSGVPVEIRSDAFTLHGRTLILSLARDVAERRQLQEQLLEAQKLEAVGRLAGGVAHDFNNVLTVIQGNADLLLRSFQPGHPQRELVEEILDAAKGAAEMTGRLLAFARRRRVQPSVFDVNELLGGMRRVLQRLLGDRIELALVPGRESVRVKVDPGQIEQVLINLAVNARDAMPAGGRLVLETGVLRVDGAYPVRELSAIVAGTYATIAVTDTGEGMTAEVRSHIFEPFFTTKGRGGGTGLGLATVYAIVQQHAGHVTVDSEPGRGTTFRLFLPCVDEQAAAVAGGPTQTPAAPGAATILVVEDDPPVRRFTADALRRIGYAVLTAEDAADALRILTEQNGKTVDLVLADVMMPGMDGRELVRRIQELHPSIAAVLMSASASVPPAGGPESPPGQMLGKPFTVDQLAHHVARVLAVRR